MIILANFDQLNTTFCVGRGFLHNSHRHSTSPASPGWLRSFYHLCVPTSPTKLPCVLLTACTCSLPWWVVGPQNPLTNMEGQTCLGLRHLCPCRNLSLKIAWSVNTLLICLKAEQTPVGNLQSSAPCSVRHAGLL